jgi:hypothetical protein
VVFTFYKGFFGKIVQRLSMKIQVHRSLKKSFLWKDDKYETVTVDSGYKIYMKLHVRNISRTDFMEYRSAAWHGHCKKYKK